MTDDEAWTALLDLFGDPHRAEVFAYRPLDRQRPRHAAELYVVMVPGMPDPEYGGQDFSTYVSRECAIRLIRAGAKWMGDLDQDPSRGASA